MALPWEPLSEEELKFCWQCLVDQGQLTAPKLQKFMLEVTGEELTLLQAKDLLGYLDATGDGRVGMEEFRHFMSTSELDMTDPQTFLWSPTTSFRQRMGYVRVSPHGTAGAVSASGFGEPAEKEEKSAKEEDPWGFFSEAEAPSTEFSRSMDDSKRRNSVKKSGKTHRRKHEEDLLALDEESPTVPTPDPGDAAKDEAKDVPKKQLDEKTLAKIKMSIEKHEQQTWERLHVEQESLRKKLFSHWTASGASSTMTSKEYHKMLSTMHQLARSSMPGELKPGDTLATLHYMLDIKEPEKPRTSENQRSETHESSKTSAGKDEELLLPFSVWHRCMSGRAQTSAPSEDKAKTEDEARSSQKA
ncbi:unnamed protein product [Durusdinium trenchii]|uniref:EF-hand domain-containing protein n=1 Tax=Durusdinium trenchii TaxID=1381693 RepID=A0ABP0I4J7_9DINO